MHATFPLGSALGIPGGAAAIAALCFRYNAQRRRLLWRRPDGGWRRADVSQAPAVGVLTDSGPGIQADDFALLFERYGHAKSGTQSVGTGLGLYIARR